MIVLVDSPGVEEMVLALVNVEYACKYLFGDHAPRAFVFLSHQQSVSELVEVETRR